MCLERTNVAQRRISALFLPCSQTPLSVSLPNCHSRPRGMLKMYAEKLRRPLRGGWGWSRSTMFAMFHARREFGAGAS